jgi:hypothetical protein
LPWPTPSIPRDAPAFGQFPRLSLRSWTLNHGAGNRDYGFGGIVVTRRVTENLSPGGELYHQTANAIDTRFTAGDYAVYLALGFHT